MLMLWCFLEDLIEHEVLILWEGSAMDRAMQKLVPMCEHGFGSLNGEDEARQKSRELLRLLQVEGLYR